MLPHTHVTVILSFCQSGSGPPDQWRPTDFALELVPIDLGVQLYKNGIPTEQLVELGRRALRTKHVEVSGFHVHLGRHHAGPSFWRASMKRYAALIADSDELGAVGRAASAFSARMHVVARDLLQAHSGRPPFREVDASGARETARVVADWLKRGEDVPSPPLVRSDTYSASFS